MNLKRIVLTTDFSDNASVAIPAAVELAKKFDAAVEVVHVFEDLSGYALAEGIAFDMATWSENIFKDRERKLNMLVDKISRQYKIKVTGTLLEGDPAKVIPKHLHSDSDCVVIATHGRTGLAHLLLGSIAEKIVRLAPCPVLTVR